MARSNGQRAILKIVDFWTPEHLNTKMGKIREVEAKSFVLAVSERLDYAIEEFDQAAYQVLRFKTGIHVYDVVEQAETFAGGACEAG